MSGLIAKTICISYTDRKSADPLSCAKACLGESALASKDLGSVSSMFLDAESLISADERKAELLDGPLLRKPTSGASVGTFSK